VFKPFLCTLALAALALAPMTSQAVAVTYSFVGQVESDDADRGLVSFTGSFSFESNTADAIADASTGAYSHSGAPWGMTLAFDGGLPFTLNTTFSVLVSNDLPGGDQWGLLAQSGADAVSLALYDYSGSVFSGDALPIPQGGLTLAGFAWNELSWESAGATLKGRLTSLGCIDGCVTSPVPEPSTLLLAGAGLLALRLRVLGRGVKAARHHRVGPKVLHSAMP
jgi:hypothetical protein